MSVDVFWFDIDVAGPVTDDHVDKLAESLHNKGGIDATVQADERGGTVMFSRKAEDAAEAILTAIEDLRAADFTVTGIGGGDLVSIEEVALRAKVSMSAARHWAGGLRGPGGFPPPVQAKLYSWATVSEWLIQHKLGSVDHTAGQVARAAVYFNALLTVERTRESIPSHRRKAAEHEMLSGHC
ncbi:hypothetical protein [Microbispora bryophytorum]|uniref:hypothetical protein n=1 Tax=Microbispora bryophytorum TaxID=1460882 RepID=UPI003715EFBF